MSFYLAAGWLWVWMGYTVAQIHSHTGSLDRYQHSVLHRSAVWLFLFAIWPMALCLYEDQLSLWCKWRPYGKR